MRQWLDQELSTKALNACIHRHLSGDHPDDGAILESFRWFINGSVEYHESLNGGSVAASPRSVHSSSESAPRGPGRAASLPAMVRRTRLS
jgi:hypothetical protein